MQLAFEVLAGHWSLADSGEHQSTPVESTPVSCAAHINFAAGCDSLWRMARWTAIVFFGRRVVVTAYCARRRPRVVDHVFLVTLTLDSTVKLVAQ